MRFSRKKVPDTFSTKFYSMLKKRGYLKRIKEPLRVEIQEDLQSIEKLLESHEAVKNRDEFTRSYRRIHALLRRLFVKLKQIKDFQSEEKKLEPDDQITYAINTWSGRILNRPIRSILGLGFKVITRPELNSNFFFAPQEEITVATPLYATVPSSIAASARYVRDDKRNTRESARVRLAPSLATLNETPSELYATAAVKYPLARYSRRNPYNETPHSKSRKKYKTARQQHNASNLDRRFHLSRLGRNHLRPEDYQGTAF